MRNTIKFLMLITVLGLFSSCRGEPGRDGLDGRDGIGVINTYLINVPRESWQYSQIDDNNYFFATVKMPEITEPVFDNGLFKMYRVFDYDSADATQIEMPYVRHNEEFVEDNQKVFYTETVDYEIGIGNITIYYTESDFNYEIDETFIPEQMQFRCVVMY